jgi:hypothetical protein
MALEAIVPNYHSISDFRKTILHCLEKLFKLYVLLKDADLIGLKPLLSTVPKAEPTIAARKPILIKRKSTNM